MDYPIFTRDPEPSISDFAHLYAHLWTYAE